MKLNLIISALLIVLLVACRHSHSHDTSHHHEDETPGFQFTAYSEDFEIFAEADAFVAGLESNVLTHISVMPDFKPLEHGSVTLVLTVAGQQTQQVLKNPSRKGIYSFDITPVVSGTGTIHFEIDNGEKQFVVTIPNVSVYDAMNEAKEAASKIKLPETNTTVFTKEQSWKVDFATDYPKTEPFGQVIKTTALVQPEQGNESVITAKFNGVVQYSSSTLLEGISVKAGQPLMRISSGHLAENNMTVKYAEATSNYLKAEADYERAKELANERIVSEKELLVARNHFETSKAVFDNLRKHFSANGETITSPQTGYIKQVFVNNGAYVEAGQPIAVVSQNETLLLRADVPVRHAPELQNIHAANIRNIVTGHSYTLEALNGKILSYGRATNSDNFLIPVHLMIENDGSFVPGCFAEVYLKLLSNHAALTVPNGALLEAQGVFFVWVQVHPELFEKREVTVGATDGTTTEIKKGISFTDRIVTRGAILIKLAEATSGLDPHAGHVH